MEGNLPNWAGASYCYSKAYRLLEKMSANGHIERKWHPDGFRCAVSQEMNNLIKALEIGDEEEIKCILLYSRLA